MKKYYSRGFTLIELLVVIAIIGILSAVVLTSLGTARSKARIASVQQTMHSLQAAAAICENDGLLLNVPTNSVDGGLAAICTGSAATYQPLPAGWYYCSDSACANTASTTARFGQSQGVWFRLVVGSVSTADNKMILCNDSSCYTY